MKFIFKSPYKSIDKGIASDFDNLEFPDFTVITGTNGSGKTQLLEALSKKSIQIDCDGIQGYGPSILFNYNNFILQSEISKVQVNIIGGGTNKTHLWYSKVITLQNNLASISKSYFQIVDFHKMLEEFWKKFEKEQDSITKLDIKDYQEIATFLEKYIDVVKEIIKQLNPIILDFFRGNEDLIKELRKKGEKFSWLSVSAGNYHENYLGQLIFQSAKHYFRNKELFMGQGIENPAETEGNIDERKILDKQELKKCKETLENAKEILNKLCLKKHGENPIKILNEILETYSVNDYFFSEDFPNKKNLLLINDEEFAKYPYNPMLGKNGTKLQISELSSGEKSLLALASLIANEKMREKENDEFSGVLLLDEIDTNLHPSMVENLLRVLKEIFINRYDFKIILVTHSPTTIALSNEDSIFTMYRQGERENRIEKTSKDEALNVLTEGYMTLDKGIKLLNQISTKEILIITEGKNTEYLKKALEYFGRENKNKIEIITGAENKTGKNQLKTIFEFISIVPHYNKVFFIWDCDVDLEKFNLKEHQNTIPYAIPKNEDNKKVTKGIENLFPSDVFCDSFYQVRKDTDYGGTFTRFNKSKFLKYMIENGTKKDFQNFKPLFDFINETLKQKSTLP